MVSGWVVLTMSVILIILGSIAAALVAFGKKWILHRMFAGLVCIQICPLIYGSVVVLGEKFETLILIIQTVWTFLCHPERYFWTWI